VFAWEGTAPALGLSQSFQIRLDVFCLQIVANKIISIFICILQIEPDRVLQCGMLIPGLPRGFLIQLVLGLFLVAGLPDVLSRVGAAGARTTCGCVVLVWSTARRGAWWQALQWPLPPERRCPQNDHGANAVFAEIPPILSGGLAANEIPHHDSQKWLRRDASVGGPFLGWASAKHTA